MGNFDSSLGGHCAGQSWRTRCPPIYPMGMPFLLSFLALGVGNEDRWRRQLCSDKYPQAVQSPQPLALPLAGWQNGKSYPLVPGSTGASAREAGNAQLA
jgi:hypothetical protein